MKTVTHYTDANGQHVLPMLLKNIEMKNGATVATEYDLADCDEPEIDEMKRVLRGFGFDTLIDDSGSMVMIPPRRRRAC